MKQMGKATKIKKAELNKASQDEKTRGALDCNGQNYSIPIKENER